MPLHFISLICWHVLSRILAIYLTVTTTRPISPNPGYDQIGNLLVVNAALLLILTGAFVIPPLFTTELGRSRIAICVIGLLLASLSGVHDLITAFGLLRGEAPFLQALLDTFRTTEDQPAISVAWSLLLPCLLAVSAIACLIARRAGSALRDDSTADPQRDPIDFSR